jgi:pimeloyl-ACP methyl ester carboxylesterase
MICFPNHMGRSEVTVPEIELSAGTIEYEDTGGGPTIVLLHGLMMDASLWHAVIADLSVDHRCVAPTLPLGAHRHAMHADADLRPVHAADASASGPATPDRVRMADQARRCCDRPVDEAGHEAARDPP